MKITEKRNNRDFISKKNRDFLIKLMKISEISRLFSNFENNREITENNREITEIFFQKITDFSVNNREIPTLL